VFDAPQAVDIITGRAPRPDHSSQPSRAGRVKAEERQRALTRPSTAAELLAGL
jgi:hypothetical protein